MKVRSRELEGEGISSQVTKNKTKATINIRGALEALVHLDSDGVQAVSNLLQLRVAFTNLLNKGDKKSNT